MIYEISIEKRNIKATINLPSSKSISNRTLIINALKLQSISVVEFI
jgi:5-enolpyruvylshikimate-3-phosphate synthase